MSALPSLDTVVTPALLVDGPTLVENPLRVLRGIGLPPAPGRLELVEPE